MIHPLVRAGVVRLAWLAALPLYAATASAQLVTPKTAPVHQSEQFDIYPSSRPGMTGIGIALSDTLFDPFANPAKAARVGGNYLFSVPSSHGITGDRGGGRTLPVGGMATLGSWSFAGVVALQQLDRAGPVWNRPTTERTATNRYLQSSVARRLPGDLMVGVGAFQAELGAIDGVDLLYGGSDRIDQDGSLTDLRLGVVKQWEGDRTLEVMLLHNRTDMTHDVRFPAIQRWDPRTGQLLQLEPARDEHNVDRTHIWGAHTSYARPVGREGWRLGWIGTVNRLSHPKIPNYVFMNIPRDPGTTYAFNAGVGAARIEGPVTFALDFVYEPMWSETWADAERDTSVANGPVVRAGQRTVENEFRFSNAKLRVGAGRDFALGRESETALGVQFGLSVYSIAYDLEQTNFLAGSFREQHEDWIEWTPSLALRLRGRNMELAYTARVTCGASGCDSNDMILPMFGGRDVAVASPGAGGIIAAPSGPLFIDGGSSWAHRVTIAVPVR